MEMQVWRLNEKTGEWQQEGPALTGHSDWVRDVAWAPNLGLPSNTLASAGQDGKVLIWSEGRDAPGTWTPTLLHDFKVRRPSAFGGNDVPCMSASSMPSYNVLWCRRLCGG